MLKTFMKPALAVTAAVTLFASVASARLWGHGKSGLESGSITIINDAQLGNGPEIKAGNYKVELVKDSPNAELAFYQHGKLVLQAPATLVNENKKIDSTEITYNNANPKNKTIDDMKIQGWDQEVVFKSHGQS